jgi:hypothetical protein
METLLCVSRAACWCRPIIFRDAGPEFPYRANGEKGEERFEETAVDLAIRRIADVYADHVLKYLSNCEQESSDNEVD